MAKLTGVKTIDMVGGEITKVEYNGELYAKVDDDATSGDILLIVEPYIDTEKGNFYFARSQTTRSVVFDDDVNDSQTRIKSGEGHFIAYRKVTTQPTSLESRVETLETKVAALEGNEVGESEYRKVTDREPRVGDFVKYDKYPNTYGELTVGEYYEIKEIDNFNDPQIVDDDGGLYDTSGDEFEVYEKIGAADESTALRVGDYAKVLTTSKYKNGKPGSIVKIINTSYNSKHTPEYTVQAVELGGNSNLLFRPRDIVKISDEEVAEALAKAKEAERWATIGRKPNEYKRGDIVRVIDGEGSAVKTGDIGEIVQIDGDTVPYKVETAHAKTGNFQRLGCIELITPVEQRFDLSGGDSE